MTSITELGITVLMYKYSAKKKKGNAGFCSKMILTQLV